MVDDPHPLRARGLLAVALISLALKLALVFVVGEIKPIRDERDYLAVGRSLAAGQGFQYRNDNWDELHSPPAYPLFMGLVFRLGGGAQASKVAQVLLSTATVLALYALGRRWFGRRAAFWAALLAAFYPTLVAFTHYNWPETVFLFWAYLAFLCLFGRDGGLNRPLAVSGAGLLFGLAALTRAEVVLLAPLLMLWIVVAGGRTAGSVGKAALFGGCFALALAPWVVHVHRAYGGFLLGSSASANVVYFGYNDYALTNVDLGMKPEGQGRLDHRDRARPRAEHENPIERSREEMRRGLRWALENPGTSFTRFWVRVGYLFNPSSFLVRHVCLNEYNRNAEGEKVRKLPRRWKAAIVWTAVGAYVLVSVLGIVGLATLPAGPARSFSLLVIVFYLAVFGATYACTRYRLTFLPLVLLAAGRALAHRRECARALRRPGPAAWTVGALAVHLWVWVLYSDKLLDC